MKSFNKRHHLVFQNCSELFLRDYAINSYSHNDIMNKRIEYDFYRELAALNISFSPFSLSKWDDFLEDEDE